MQSLETFCQGAKKKQCKRIRQWSNHLGHSASGSKSRWLQPSHAWCEANPCHCAPNVGRYTFHAKVDKYATFYFGHCKDFYMDQARNSWISLILVGGTIMWRGCSRKLFRAGKRSHKGKERRMRGHLDGSGLKRSELEMHLGGTAGDEEEGLERWRWEQTCKDTARRIWRCKRRLRRY